MLVVAGVVTQVIQDVIIYKQGNIISKLQAENKNLSTELRKRLKKIEQEKNEQIGRLIEERNIYTAEKQELMAKNLELMERMDAERVERQELIIKLRTMLGIPIMQDIVQNWQAAGMYRSNLSEPLSEPSTIKNSEEEESCTETVSMSGSDIETIDPIIPSTSIDELRLNNYNQVGK